MLKILLTLLVIVLALMWWFGKGRVKDARPGKAPSGDRRVAAPMIGCAHCGLHLPQVEAVEGEGGRLYCSAEHRRLGPSDPR